MTDDISCLHAYQTSHMANYIMFIKLATWLMRLSVAYIMFIRLAIWLITLCLSD